MVIRRIDDLGRLQLPKDYRKTLDIHEGDELVIELKDGYMSVKKEEKKIGEEGMERLTKETIGCFKYTLKDHVGDFGEYNAFFDYSMAVKRLGEYEDTGLTPEEVHRLKAKYEALESDKNAIQSSLINTEMNLEAQQQEIDELKDQNDTLYDTVNMFAPYIIGKKEAEVVEDLKELLTLKRQIEALTADKDEQAGRIMRLEKVAKDLYFAYINKDEDFPHSFETKAIEKYKALLGGAEDGK